MKRIHSAKDPLMIGHLKNVLATFGIRCIARKIDLSTAAGELPPIECWPELWVIDDDKAAKAKSILRKVLAPLESVKKPWVCLGCGETLEGQFSECWNCGRDRSGRRPHGSLRLLSTYRRHR
jgi:putative signal transducing protein